MYIFLKPARVCLPGAPEQEVSPSPRPIDKGLFDGAEQTGTWGGRVGRVMPLGETAGGRVALACRAAGLAGNPVLREESRLETLNVHSLDDFMEYQEPGPHAAPQLAAREREIKLGEVTK